MEYRPPLAPEATVLDASDGTCGSSDTVVSLMVNHPGLEP